MIPRLSKIFSFWEENPASCLPLESLHFGHLQGRGGLLRLQWAVSAQWVSIILPKMSSLPQKLAKRNMWLIYVGGYHQDQTPGTKTGSLITNYGWGTQKRLLWTVVSKTNTRISLNTRKRHSNSTWITLLTVILTRRRDLRFSITPTCFLLLLHQ